MLNQVHSLWNTQRLNNKIVFFSRNSCQLVITPTSSKFILYQKLSLSISGGVKSAYRMAPQRQKPKLLESTQYFLRLMGICEMPEDTHWFILYRNKLFGLFVVLNMAIVDFLSVAFAFGSFKFGLTLFLRASLQVCALTSAMVTMICIYFNSQGMNRIFAIVQHFHDTSTSQSNK